MKRGRNEGSIRQRDDGQWEARLTLGYKADGTRVRPSVYGATKREVLDALAKLRVNSGAALSDGASMTLDTWFSMRLEVVKAERRHKTYVSYADIVTRLLRPAVGHLKLNDVRPSTMDVLKAALRKAETPAATAWYACIVFKIFVRAAAAKELIAHNPFADVRLEKPAVKKMATWSVEEAQRFFAVSAKSDPLHAMYVACVQCGLRHAEALALKASDFDFAKGTLNVTRQLIEVREPDASGLRKWKLRFELQDVKTEASKATIKVPQATLQVIKAHIAKHFVGRDGFLFLTSNGTHYSQNNVRKAFKRTVAQSGVPRIRIHDLRHTCATLLLEKGKELIEIQYLLRHANYAVTANTYAHVTTKMAQGVADAMDGIFADKAGGNGGGTK